MSQAKVNASIVEALAALGASDVAAADMTKEVVDKLLQAVTLLEQLAERVELAVELVTTHVDNHE